MRKATAINFYVREIYGQASQIFNAREELSRGHKPYGIGWKFYSVDKAEFLKEIEADNKFTAIETLSGKFIEVDKDNINKFNI